MEAARTRKGEQTRAAILSEALALFRQRGFDGTSMREIAAATGLALGAAYHYFPSKEAIVTAYYEEVQEQHEARVQEAWRPGQPARERVAIALHAKIDILRRDRKLLGALFRRIGDRADPLSPFSPDSGAVRRRSIAIFSAALGEELPEAARQTLPLLLWTVHLGLILYFVHDGSARQQRTRALIDGVADLLPLVVGASRTALAQPLLARVTGLMRDAGLLPGDAA